jgi:superfamily I DNA/RNA helicase
MTMEEIRGITVAEAVRRTAIRLGGQADTTDAIRHLLDLAGEFGDDLDRFLRFVSIGTGLDTIRRTSEAVSLLTLHAAKGLEFPHVFIAGCEDGLLPYRMFGDPGDVEEERRLLYVGMTRVKETLTLTYAEKRNLFGRTYNLPRSPFLDEIQPNRYRFIGMEKKSGKKTSQLGLFDLPPKGKRPSG